MAGHKMDTSQCLISYIIGHRKTVTGGVVYVEKGRKVSKTAGISSIPTRLIPHLFHTTSPSNLSLSSSSHSHHSALSLPNHLSINFCKRLSNTTATNTLTIFNHKRYRISTEELKRISISRTILSPTGFSINSQESIE